MLGTCDSSCWLRSLNVRPAGPPGRRMGLDATGPDGLPYGWMLRSSTCGTAVAALGPAAPSLLVRCSALPLPASVPSSCSAERPASSCDMAGSTLGCEDTGCSCSKASEGAPGGTAGSCWSCMPWAPGGAHWLPAGSSWPCCGMPQAPKGAPALPVGTWSDSCALWAPAGAPTPLAGSSGSGLGRVRAPGGAPLPSVGPTGSG